METNLALLKHSLFKISSVPSVVSDFSSANVSRSGLRGTPEEEQAPDSTEPSEVATS